MLFNISNPTYKGSATDSESYYSFLNRSGQNKAVNVRTILEEWFKHYPEYKKPDISHRFQSDDNMSFISSFFDLYIHELLINLGYKPEINPGWSSESTIPNLLARSSSNNDFYIDTITITDTAKDKEINKAREKLLYEILNRLDFPYCFLGIKLKGNPNTSPPVTKMKSFLENWLKNIDPGQLENFNFYHSPKLHFFYNDWNLEFYPIPKSQDKKTALNHEIKWENSYMTLRDAILKKANKYGSLDHAFIVAVNCLNWPVKQNDVIEALFGQEQYVVSRDNPPGMTKIRNGVWFGKAGIQNKRISAVLICNNILPWNISEKDICLYHNPWAAIPCKGNISNLSEVFIEDGKVNYKKGIHPRHLFQIV